MHKKEVVEKENTGPEEAGLFFCSTNRGPGEAPAAAPPGPAPSSTAGSAPLVAPSRGDFLKFSADPQHSHRGSGKAKATVKPFHISMIQANTRQKIVINLSSSENQQ